MGMDSAGEAIHTSARPARDTVLYDGECRFCRGQVAMLRRLDWLGRLVFRSLHEPEVAQDFPELSREALMREMMVVDRQGRAWGGAAAVRHLSRALPLLWPLALPLHVPGTLPGWSWLYAAVARNRYRLGGRCVDGTCQIERSGKG